MAEESVEIVLEQPKPLDWSMIEIEDFEELSRMRFEEYLRTSGQSGMPVMRAIRAALWVQNRGRADVQAAGVTFESLGELPGSEFRKLLPPAGSARRGGQEAEVRPLRPASGQL